MISENHKQSLSVGLTISIVILTIFIIHRFIPSLIWASIIVIATYPLYLHWRRFFGKKQNLSAFLFTSFLVLLLVIPLSWLISVLIKDFHVFFNYLQLINRNGGQAPDFIQTLPYIGRHLVSYWDSNIGQPGSITYFLSNLHAILSPSGYYIKQVGTSLAHKGFQIGFTLLALFFFYRDGDQLFLQINHVGRYCLGERWARYADRLPAALRATVNGTIVVGIGVGVLMGVCYGLVGFPAPALMGFFTALAAMIPFVVPVVFVITALILLINGAMFGAIIVLVWGTFVMFVADHFIKPVLIGGAIQLPFLAVLFGILGGLETLGLLGLFVGPIIMVLFMTLWYESQGLVHAK